MTLSIIVFAFLIFVAYALYTQYTKTPADQWAPSRVWASLVDAAATLGALLSSCVGGGAPTQ